VIRFGVIRFGVAGAGPADGGSAGSPLIVRLGQRAGNPARPDFEGAGSSSAPPLSSEFTAPACANRYFSAIV
jgi:hypothetical protein